MTEYSDPSRSDLAKAWSVHLFTASGAVWGFLALLAIGQGNWLAAVLWMMVTVFIDSTDGVLARRFRVKDVLPGFDGALLDNMVDFFTYVIVPALFIYQAGLLPLGWDLFGVIVLVLVSSYQFSQADAKAGDGASGDDPDDHVFKGFPSYWNVVATYMLIMALNPWVNLAVLLFLAVMVFVPIKYVYHSRTVEFRPLTIALTVIWGLLIGLILFNYPDHDPALGWYSLIYVAYYVGVSLYLRWKKSGSILG